MFVRTYLVILLLVSLPAVTFAGTFVQIPENTDVAYAPHCLDLIPTAIQTFVDKEAVTNRFLNGVPGNLENGSIEVLKRPSIMKADYEPRSNPANQRRYLPILMSAIVPGSGELYLGHVKRGIALMALEAGAWTGYLYYQNKGLDTREEYETFADRHWDLHKWADHHPEVYPYFTGFSPEQMDSIGHERSGTGSWPGYIPYVSIQEDKQHYYENIGKYDWYISGWEDYDPDWVSPNPDDPPYQRDTNLRDEYRSLRNKSNDQLDNSSRFVYLSLATRVFSLVQTILLTRDMDGGEAVDATNNKLSLRARARGYGGGEIALEYRFK